MKRAKLDGTEYFVANEDVRLHRWLARLFARGRKFDCAAIKRRLENGLHAREVSTLGHTADGEPAHDCSSP